MSEKERELIAKIAECVRKSCYYKDLKDYPVDAEKIAERYGINVQKEADFSGVENGSYEQTGNSKTIKVSSDVSKENVNFTIAHELGHAILHANMLNKQDASYNSQTYYQNNGDYSVEEEEANEFAFELLMPKEEYIEKAKQYSGEEDPIHKIANDFGVSEATAKYRGQRLGVVKCVSL